jgi:hypothetical protein
MRHYKTHTNLSCLRYCLGSWFIAFLAATSFERLADTETGWDVHVAIGRFRETVRRRPRQTIPH